MLNTPCQSGVSSTCGRTINLSSGGRASGLLAATLGLSAAAPHLRHRLPRNLPASPCGPFIVELFAGLDLPASPDQVRDHRLFGLAFVEMAIHDLFALLSGRRRP
jgi:hypothetical protein